MALYEVTLNSRYFEQQVINRWNYLGSGAGVGINGAAALAAAMGFVPTAGNFPADTIARDLQLLQPPDVTYVGVLIRCLYDAPTDFYDQSFPSGVIGDQTTGEAASPTLAYGFRTNRTRSDIDRGTKRFVGVTENAMDAGGVVASGTLGVMDILAVKMSATLGYTTGGSTFSFVPIVVQKEMYTTPPAPKAYRYFETEAEQLDHIAQNITWTSYDRVRTQVSRQYGHGA